MIKKYLIYRTIRRSGFFDSEYYLNQYADVKKKKINPIRHYCYFGWAEGRNPAPGFITDYYLETYPLVIKSGINPLIHYIRFGQWEGYKTNPHGDKLPVIKQTYISRWWILFVSLVEVLNKKPHLAIKAIKVIRDFGIREAFRRIKSIIGIEKVNRYQYNKPEFTYEISRRLKSFKYKPLISVIMPVYNVEPKWLDLAVKSVLNQWYDNWELCIVDDASTNKDTIKYLKSIDNPKIQIALLKKNMNISGASNEALKLAKGEYIALLDHDDELTVDALYEMVKVINENDAEFIYSDEDKVELNGDCCCPRFKPDYSPDKFLSENYICHLTLIKKSLVDRVDGFTLGVEGAQDYDLFLKVLEHTEKVCHIQKILYHWRKIPGSTAAFFNEKAYAKDASLKALKNAVKRRGLDAQVLHGKYPGIFRIKYRILSEPLISIIIPFKDKPDLLNKCIESVITKSTYKNYEIIGISNNRENPETFMEMKRLQKRDKRIHFYEYNVPFNYSGINNFAVNNFAKGEHIVLMNNDIEIISPDWIECMLEFSQRDDVGVVGSKLYYPDDTVQHAGLLVGVMGVAGHSHRFYGRDHNGYFSRLCLVQNISAVSASLFMVKKSLYKNFGGFNDADLKIAFNDVDFCLRVREAGYLNVFTPYSEAYHQECVSRGCDDTHEKRARYRSEVAYMKKRHKKVFTEGDPYYNINLTLEREDFSLK